jgi:UDP-N-acetylmuramyl pentapeptide phosphotransferase/UDP-N-acetylglucosamine-1-phosphate transferase
MMIGGTLAAASIIGERNYDVPVSAFVLLFAAFIGDTAYTLARRALRGEKIWRAHREHVYQRATRTGLGHSSVTVMVLLISMIMCLPASLEMGRSGPRVLWPALSLLVLSGALYLVKRRESRRQ